jgi:hypothetical protein
MRGRCSQLPIAIVNFKLLYFFASDRETEWMATFIWHLAKKFGGKNWRQNNPGSNGQEEMSPGSLLLTIKITYIILKNNPWRNLPHKPEYS